MTLPQQATAIAVAFFTAFPCVADEAALSPIVVTATRQAMRANELLSDVTVIEHDDIEQAGPSSTIAELLARQPGVEMVRNGSPGSVTDIRLRGANANQTILMIDGVRVGSATTGSPTWSRIPLSEIDRVEILRGPASSVYGNDAIGGVVQIFTRRGDGPARVFVEAGAGTQDTNSAAVGISGGNNGWHYNLNTASLRTRGISNIVNPGASGYNPDKDGYNSLATSGGLSYSPAKGHEFGITFFNSTGRNKYDSGFSAASQAKDYQNQSDVTSYSAFTRNALTEHWTSTLRFGYSDDDSTAYTDAQMTSIFRTEQTQISWQNDLKLPVVGNMLLALEQLDQRVSGTGNFTTAKRTIDSVLAGWNRGFGIHRLQANLRRDDNSQFGGKTTGNAGYGIQISDAWRANASYGTAYKAPTFNDLYYPLTFGYVGNPNLKPETARNHEFSLHYEQGLHQASATYYLNKIADLISWSGRTSPVNIGNATLEGVTLAYQGRMAGLDIGASIDWQDPRDDATGKTLARRARERGTFSIGKRLGDWNVRAEMQTVGKRYDTDANTDILGGYTLFNLYGSYTLARDWSLFARADNIFDKKYEQALNYGTPGASVFVGLRYTPKR